MKNGHSNRLIPARKGGQPECEKSARKLEKKEEVAGRLCSLGRVLRWDMPSLPSLFDLLEQAELANDLGNALPILTAQVRQGKVSLETPDGLVIERVLFDHQGVLSGNFEAFQPLLEALVERGHSAWKLPDGKRRGLYRFLCDDPTDNQPVLKWLWNQPDAPPMDEATLDQQIRLDQLKGLLSSHSVEYACAHLFKHTNRFPLEERWADGKTSFHHVVGTLLDKLPQKRKGFEWQNDLRLYRRLFKAVREHLPPEECMEIVVPAALAAGRAWKSHQDVTRFVQSEESRPSWIGPWHELLKDIAPTRGSKRGTVADGWQAFVRWASEGAPSVAAIGAIAAGSEVMAGAFPEFKTEQARRQTVDSVVQALETMGMERLLASGESLTKHYPLTSPLWMDFATTFGRVVTWSPSEVWKVLLPAQLTWGTEAPSDRPCLGYSPHIASSLERWLPKGETFQWPDSPFWNQVVAHWGWTPELQAQARAKSMDQALPKAASPGRRPRM